MSQLELELRLSSSTGLTDPKFARPTGKFPRDHRLAIYQGVVPLLETRDLASFHQQESDSDEPHSSTRSEVHRHFVDYYRPKIPRFLVALHDSPDCR